MAVPDMLPQLIRRPGMTSWQVLDNNLKPAPHPDGTDAAAMDAAEEAAPVEQEGDKTGEGKGNGKASAHVKGSRKTWSKTLWPVGDEKELGLEHCLRLYPHLQDTGAFFVCVLVKKGDEAAGAAAPTAAEQASEAQPASGSGAEKRERASSPSRPEGEPESKKAKQAEGEEATPAAVAMEATPAAASEGKKEQTFGAGRPFNEEPYIYLPGLEDEQVKVIKCVPGQCPHSPRL